MKVAEPHSSEPTGALRPFETQKPPAEGGDAARRHAERLGRVEEPRAVDMHRNTALARKCLHRRHMLERGHGAASVVMARLDGDEAGRQPVVREPGLSASRSASRSMAPRGAGSSRWKRLARPATPPISVREMWLPALTRTSTPLPVWARRATRLAMVPLRQEETRLLAGALGAERFETLDRRVAVAGIIARASLRHGFAHALVGEGHRVAAQIDGGHDNAPRSEKRSFIASQQSIDEGKGLSVMTMRSEAAATAVPAPVPSNAWNMTTVSVCQFPL